MGKRCKLMLTCTSPCCMHNFTVSSMLSLLPLHPAPTVAIGDTSPLCIVLRVADYNAYNMRTMSSALMKTYQFNIGKQDPVISLLSFLNT